MSRQWLQHPDWLEAILLGLAATGLALLLARRRARRRGRSLLGPRAPRAGAASDALLWLALLGVGAALLGPRVGLREQALAAGGADVVVLLDVSRSMTAADAPPTRLHRARRSADAVLARLDAGDRAALAAFAGHGVLLTPLSADAAALRELLPHLDETLIGAGGSNADDGIAVALEALAAAPSERPRAILLLSDGEDPARRGADAAAATAARAGVRIVSAAFGSEAGAPLGGAVLRETGGRTVVSRRDAAALARLAEQTGGAAFVADAWGELNADALVAALRGGAAATPGATRSVRVPAVQTGVCAALAFGVLLLELLGAGERARLRRAGAALVGVAGATALLGTTPGEAPPTAPAPGALEQRLREAPGDPRALLWLGLARAERGDADGAALAFRAAALLAREPRLGALAWHDLGVTELSRGELESARDAFFAALALDPSRRQTVFNLEWTLEALAERPPPQGGDAEREEESDAERERPAPEPAPGEAGDPAEAAPAPAGETGPETDTGVAPAEPAAPPPPELSDAEARRWLDAAPDDAARALRGAAARAGATRPRPRGPGW